MKINDQLEVLKRLNSFSQGFGKITTVEELASSVSEVLEDLLDFDASGLYLFDFHEKKIRLLIVKGFSDEERAEADKKAMERHPGFMFTTGQVLILPETKNDSLNQTSSVVSMLCFPVINKNEPVGEFGLFSRKNNFNEEYEVIFSLVCNIAGTIYTNILNYAEVKKTVEQLGVSKAKDAINKTTGIPTQSISDINTSPKKKNADPDKQFLQYDLSKLSRLLSDDKDEIIYLLEHFIELIPEYSAVLFTAFEQNNIAEVEKSAHKIKASLELVASGNLCSNIKLINEYARKRENLEKLPNLVKYYQDNITILISQLSGKVAELKKVTRDT